MAEQDKPFVINDRRKFRMDGELREPQPDTQSNESEEQESPKPSEGGKVISFADAAAAHHDATQAEADDDEQPAPERHNDPIPFRSHTVTPEPEPEDDPAPQPGDENLPPPPTPEEIEQVKHAYESTAERLDTVMRATNPGGEHMPPMDFTRLVQSVYMSAMVQMGAGTPQGEQARVDLIGARQSIDMLAVIAEKSGKNLDSREQLLIDSALFELRMGFLEITQILARQAASRQQPGAPGFGGPGAPGTPGPRIVS